MEKEHLLTAANCADGIHGGDCTFIASAPFPVRHLLACFDGTGGKIKPCGASNLPIGTVTDEATTDDAVNVHFLGGNGTALMVAAGAIARGAILAPAANGKVQVATSGLLRVGIAIGDAQGADDRLEVLPFTPSGA
ncbi:MAG: DUF2190 family protein [Puniceicoccales bacterium]|jgi:hypothetical protein|nr:DUF2190 family protein [Puniceicoccales bacterium]